jgi:hypothetical protein
VDVEEHREQVAHKQALLKKFKDYLQVAELQLSNHGLTPPIPLVLDIKECKDEISQLERDIVNLRNDQLKLSSKVVYPRAEYIINIEDTDGEISYRITFDVLDINISALNTSIVDKLIRVILDYYHGNELDVYSDFGDGNIKSRRRIYSNDHGEIVEGIKTHIKSLKDRGLARISGSLAFHGGSERIGFIIWDNASSISITDTDRNLVISVYNILAAFFKLLD